MSSRFLCRGLLSVALCLGASLPACADPVRVQHVQGALHGFLVIRSQAGSILGYGEITQLASGDRVTDHLVLHFHDGSVDDETTVFTQRETFQFVSDHHTQTGPFFKNPSDETVDANGQVTTRTTGKDGKLKEETTHIDLPADISNGMVGVLLTNVRPDQPLELGMIVPSGKGRLVKLDISPAGEQSFTVAGARRKASLFRIKLNLGGVAGVIAPIVGKQPADTYLWILEGEPPVFVREVGQLSEGGPIVSIELAGTYFSRRNAPRK